MSDTAPEPQQSAMDQQQPEQPTQQQTETLGDAGKAALDAERKRAREAEKALKAAQARLAELDEAGKSEAEKARAEAKAAADAATQWQQRYVAMQMRADITAAASAAGAIDPEAVFALARDRVEVADDGTISGVEKAIASLQKSNPRLFNTVPAGARDATAGRDKAFALNDHDALTQALLGAVGRL